MELWGLSKARLISSSDCHAFHRLQIQIWLFSVAEKPNRFHGLTTKLANYLLILESAHPQSLIAKGHHRIHAHGLPRWQVGSQQRHAYQERRHAENSRRICGTDPV
jgi:hypothetical protein